MAIKVLLVGGLVLAIVVMMRGPAHRQLAARRLIGIATAAVGAVTVVWPDLTTGAAHLVGVGRGTDLVLYVGVLGFGFVSIALYQRISRLEASITALTRELALRSVADEGDREPQRQ